MTLSQYLLFTLLPENLPADAFRQQLKAARARHAALAITGALLFDGEALLYLLEGDADALVQARLALVKGLPAGAWKVLHHGVQARERLFKDWRVGYTDPEALQLLCEQLGESATAVTGPAGAADLAAHPVAAQPVAECLAAFVQLVNASDPQ